MKYMLFVILTSSSLSVFAATPFFSAYCTSPKGTIVNIGAESGCGVHSVAIYKQMSEKKNLVYKLEGTCANPFEFTGLVDYQKNILNLTSEEYLVALGETEQFALIAVPGTIKAKSMNEYSRNVTFEADFIRKSSGTEYSFKQEKVTCKAEDFLNFFRTGDWEGNW